MGCRLCLFAFRGSIIRFEGVIYSFCVTSRPTKIIVEKAKLGVIYVKNAVYLSFSTLYGTIQSLN